MTRPELFVEIARPGTDTPRTASSTWEWHEVSPDVELQNAVSIQFGRQDKVDQADPNMLSLTFTADDYRQDLSTGEPYALLRDTNREIRKGVPIRVQAVPDGKVGNFLSANAASFETSVADWTSGGTVPPTRTHSSVRAQDGTDSMLITWGTAGTLPLVQTVLSGLTIGRTYTASAYAYVPTGDPSVLLVAATSSAFGVAMSTKNAFTRFTVTFTATDTTELLQVWPSTSPTSGDQCWLDAVQVWHGSSAVTFTTDQAADVIKGRFYGFVDSLVASFPSGSADYPEVAVNAISRLGIIARARNIQDATSAAVLAAGATSYWAMSEETPETGTTDPTSPPWFSDDPPLTAWSNLPYANVARFGWPPTEGAEPPDGLGVGNVAAFIVATSFGVEVEGKPEQSFAPTAAWSASILLRAPVHSGLTQPSITPFSFELENPGSVCALYWATNGSTGDQQWAVQLVEFDSSGSLVNSAAAAGDVDEGFRDGRWHHVVLTCSGGTNPTFTGYRDGEQIATVTLVGTVASQWRTMTTGIYRYVPATDYEYDNPRHEIGRLALFDGVALSAGDVSDLYDAIFIGEGEQTVDDRMALWFDYAGVPAADCQVTGDSEVTLLPQSPAGASPLALLQDVTTTDGGVLFDRIADATTQLYTRGHRLAVTTDPATVTLDAATEEVSADLAVIVDPAEIVNSVTAKAADNSLAVTREDTASQDAHGHIGHEETMLTGRLAYLQPRADWLLYTRKDPHPRAPTLSVQLEALDGDQQSLVMDLEPDAMVAVSGMSLALTGIPDSFFVEGGSEEWTPEGCRLTLNTTDAAFEMGTFVLDDPAGRGVLTSTPVLA